MRIKQPLLQFMTVGWIAASVLSVQAADHQAHGAPAAAHWGYEGEQGARHWGTMEPGFALCQNGKAQSPIDIQVAAGAVKPAPMVFSYAQSAAEVINNGHTIQVNVADGGSITLEGVDYKLVQFHFHTPSEEKVRGQAYPLEAHLVHKSADGQLAVVAVLFEEGDENQALKAIFSGLPVAAEKTLATRFNPASLLPAYQGYYQFMGSLTTPPCSEGVRWQVLKQRVELSRSQLAAFRKLYKMNARPVQPVNDRKVAES